MGSPVNNSNRFPQPAYTAYSPPAPPTEQRPQQAVNTDRQPASYSSGAMPPSLIPPGLQRGRFNALFIPSSGQTSLNNPDELHTGVPSASVSMPSPFQVTDGQRRGSIPLDEKGKERLKELRENPVNNSKTIKDLKEIVLAEQSTSRSSPTSPQFSHQRGRFDNLLRRNSHAAKPVPENVGSHGELDEIGLNIYNSTKAEATIVFMARNNMTNASQIPEEALKKIESEAKENALAGQVMAKYKEAEAAENVKFKASIKNHFRMSGGSSDAQSLLNGLLDEKKMFDGFTPEILGNPDRKAQFDHLYNSALELYRHIEAKRPDKESIEGKIRESLVNGMAELDATRIAAQKGFTSHDFELRNALSAEMHINTHIPLESSKKFLNDLFDTDDIQSFVRQNKDPELNKTLRWLGDYVNKKISISDAPGTAGELVSLNIRLRYLAALPSDRKIAPVLKELEDIKEKIDALTVNPDLIPSYKKMAAKVQAGIACLKPPMQPNSSPSTPPRMHQTIPAPAQQPAPVFGIYSMLKSGKPLPWPLPEKYKAVRAELDEVIAHYQVGSTDPICQKAVKTAENWDHVTRLYNSLAASTMPLPAPPPAQYEHAFQLLNNLMDSYLVNSLDPVFQKAVFTAKTWGMNVSNRQ
jgi:hypothetical protein